MRDKSRLVTFGWSRVNGGKPKDAGANISLLRIILDVSFADQLGPFERCLAAVISRAVFGNIVVSVRVRAVHVFGRRVDEDGVGLHVAQDARSGFGVGAKAKLGCIG